MSATDTFTLRVCITGLCLVVPDNQRLVILMPLTGPSTLEPVQHRARLRCDVANLTPNNSGSGPCAIALDGPPLQISDPYPTETYTWKSEQAYLDLTRVHNVRAKKEWLTDLSGKLFSCAVTMPMGKCGCFAHGHQFDVGGQIQDVSWLVRRDIVLTGASVDVAGRTLYPKGGILDVTLVNEPDGKPSLPQPGDQIKHLGAVYALLGLQGKEPHFKQPDGDGGTCPGYVPSVRTDAFQCMPSFAST